MNQTEFAAMIGISKDSVASWDIGRIKVSDRFARRIVFATGVDEDSVMGGEGVPTVTYPVTGRRGYTREDFQRYQGTARGRSDEAGARHHLKNCADTLRLILMAAASSGEGGLGRRLPAVLNSFIQWSEETQEEFNLGRGIRAQLEKREFKMGLTFTYGQWRALVGGKKEEARLSGFKDDPKKSDAEELRLEVKAIPGWSPGRSMQPPKPASIETVGPA
jgi:hypothetical protein